MDRYKLALPLYLCSIIHIHIQILVLTHVCMHIGTLKNPEILIYVSGWVMGMGIQCHDGCVLVPHGCGTIVHKVNTKELLPDNFLLLPKLCAR